MSEDGKAIVRLSKVTFDPQGGTLPGETVFTVTPSGRLASPLPTPFKAGSAFKGWYYDKEREDIKIPENMNSFYRDITIYAHWTAALCTVTFDANSGNTPAPASKTVTFGGTYGELPAPTRPGYAFAGWYTAADGGTAVENTATVTESQDHTLYAHWTAGQVTVKFDANGGTAAAGKQVIFGGTYGALPTPVRTGYTFDGWYTSETNGTKVTDETDVTTSGEHTLYARWNAKTVTVTLNPNGGTLAGNEAITPTFGSAYGELPAPTRTGCDFAGWFSRAAGGTQVTGASTVTRAADHTLYAHWTQIKRTVTFNTNAPGGAGTVTNPPRAQSAVPRRRSWRNIILRDGSRNRRVPPHGVSPRTP